MNTKVLMLARRDADPKVSGIPCPSRSLRSEEPLMGSTACE
jgi:hypothetical protein